MKKIYLVVVVMVFFGLCLSPILTSALPAKKNKEGYTRAVIMFKDGSKKFIPDFYLSNFFRGKIEGEEMKIPFSSLKSIEFLGRGDKYNKKLIKLVSLRDGREFILDCRWSCIFTHNTYTTKIIKYKTTNKITGEKEKQEIKWEDISKVIFNEKRGHLKFNPQTRRFFPANYKFDPETGEKLIWKNPPEKKAP